MKTIDTIVKDIYSVVEGKGGWTEAYTKFLADSISFVVEDRLSKEPEPRTELSPSSLGTLCKRQLWYKFNLPQENTYSAIMLGTFLYGDILECFVIALAQAAGHQVECIQDKVEIYGMKGSLDCIIDGWLIDVKSASAVGIIKFKNHELESNDPYGYLSQISSYLKGKQKDKRLVQKNAAGFLVINKERFELVLDCYALTPWLERKEYEVQEARDIISKEEPPDIPLFTFYRKDADGNQEPYLSIDEEMDNGNRRLGKTCVYCQYKLRCWQNLRAFRYSNRTEYFTHVEKKPRVEEIKLYD